MSSAIATSGMMNDTTTEALGRFLDVDVGRYKLITMNLANIDTPGYHARDLDFHAELGRAAAEASGMANAGAGLSLASYKSASYEPVAHTVRGLMERPDGNNVSVERESLLLAETQMKYNLGVQLLKDQFHTIALAINSGGGSSS
jgi:flagellar basal-body rod protein FlgB